MPVKGYDSLFAQVDAMLDHGRIMIPAMNSVLAAQKKRIFQDGKASNDGNIGQYSTKPASIAKKNQSRQTGKTYFKGGYREYKGLTGKGNSIVNLRNTDQMMMDLGTFRLSQNEFGIGFSNEFNHKKSEWNEKHFGKDIFKTTSSEDEVAMKTIDFEIKNL